MTILVPTLGLKREEPAPPPAEPFLAEHVTRTCQHVGRLADEIGGTLQKEFGGRRAYEEAPEGTEVQ